MNSKKNSSESFRWTSGNKMSQASAIVVIAVSALVQWGWLFDVPAMRSILPQFLAMNPVTAFCFILAGAALLLNQQETSSACRRIANLLSAIVLSAGLLRCINYSTRTDWGMDRWLFTSKLGGNRQTVSAAFCFILVGASLLGIDIETKRGWRPTQILVLFLLSIVGLVTIGYAYGVTSFSQINASYFAMAVHSALCFAAVGLGILYARPARGFMGVISSAGAGGLMARRLLPAALLLPILIGFLCLKIETRWSINWELGVASYALSMSVLFGLLTWWVAKLLVRMDERRETMNAERQVAESELQQQRIIQQSILENVGEGLVVADTTGNIILLNPTAKAILGIGIVETSRDTWSQDYGLFHSDTLTPFKAEDIPLSKATRGESSDNVEMFVRNPAIPNGTFINVTGRPVLDPKGALQGGVVIFQDITAQKQAVRELQDARDALQLRMDELKRSHDALLQAQKLEAVGRLAAGVAHEINNPLGVILGFAEASVGRLPFGDALEMPLKSIKREALRCKKLVQNLLTFSRTQNTDKSPMDVNKAVDAAMCLISALVKMGHIRIESQLTADLPFVLANSIEIEQVIINLATNALDAMNEKGVLTLRTDLFHDEGKPWVRLSVSDTGPGISPEVLPRMFDLFFTTKPVGKGTGLGLSVVNEIVHRNSWRVTVESRPGCTQFRLCLPVVSTGVAVEKRDIARASNG